MAPTLGYWALRGLAQPTRYLLEHTGVDYEDKLYTSMDVWQHDKKTLGLKLPNLPYYIDGDLKITESSAIIKYLARKHGLVGTTETERIDVDIADGVITDINGGFARLCYNENFESLKEAYIKDIGTPLGKMSTLIGENSFIIGDRVTYVDFMLFESIERLSHLVPDCLDNFSSLKAFHKRMSDLPALKKLLTSDKFQKMKTNFNGPYAKFGASVM